MNKVARIKLEKPCYSLNFIVTINLSAREASDIKAHIQTWTTFLMNMTTSNGLQMSGNINEVYTHEEILTGLTKVLEGLGYEVRS